MTTIHRWGKAFTEGGKCPACSGERDTGGKLQLRQRKNIYLKCNKCRYTIKTEKAALEQEKRLRRIRDKKLL